MVNDQLGLVVVALNEQDGFAISTPRWQRLAQDALASLGLQHGEVNLLFVDEQRMTQLNEDYLGNAYPTDVLAFPLDGDAASECGESLIGDVVVCPSRASAQAREHAGRGLHDGSVEDELAFLIVHGILHLLGFDHYDRATTEQMQAREQAILQEHYWP